MLVEASEVMVHLAPVADNASQADVIGDSAGLATETVIALLDKHANLVHVDRLALVGSSARL
jgi:hypothetical protein